MLSHDAGATSPPLLDETIGDNLASTTEAFGDREAVVECATGRRWTYREFHEATRRIATALLERGTKPGDRIGIWSPNSAEWTMIQYATAQVGAILVNINPAYRADELEYALNKASMCTVFAAPEFKSSDYVSMLDNVRGRCPALSDVIIVGWEPWQEIADTAVDSDALARVQSGLKSKRSDQHSVHVRHDRIPQGRHADPHQHPQQRLPRRRGSGVHRARQGLHPGALLPLLRHGAGQSGLHDARRRRW